jgi:thiol-disulfide isomerase/thioredoxin
MKQILLIAAVCGSLLAACNPAGFTVNGTIEDVTEGEVLLVTFPDDNNTIDTLAVAPVVNGAFTLTGKVKEVTPAALSILSIEGSIYRVSPLLIENARCTVKIGKSPVIEGNTLVAPGSATTVEGGGPVQQVFSTFFNLVQAIALDNPAYRAAGDTTARESIQELARQARQKLDVAMDEIVKAHPDSYATAYLLHLWYGQAPIEQLREQYELLGENAKASTFGVIIAERIRAETATIGQVAPDFTFTTPEGETVSLHGIAAKVKLIDFWASWCGPCRMENPNVVAAYAEYHPKGFEIVGVSLDTDKASWLQAITDDKLTWIHGSDLKGWSAAPAKLYGVNSIPHTVLLDENNRIIAKNLRGDALKQKLAELLD